MSSSAQVPSSADSARRTLWRIPSRSHLGLFLRELIRINVLWWLVYGGASYITGQHEYRVRLWTDWDLRIPFVPEAAIVYLSLFPMLWLSVLVLDTAVRLKSFTRALVWLIIVSGIGFLLLPCDDAYPSRGPTESLGTWFKMADQWNLSYNYFPSLHVGMAVVCAYSYGQVTPRHIGAIYWIWAIAIAGSTLLTHQHYAADVLAGGILGLLIAARFVDDEEMGGTAGLSSSVTKFGP